MKTALSGIQWKARKKYAPTHGRAVVAIYNRLPRRCVSAYIPVFVLVRRAALATTSATVAMDTLRHTRRLPDLCSLSRVTTWQWFRLAERHHHYALTPSWSNLLKMKAIARQRGGGLFGALTSDEHASARKNAVLRLGMRSSDVLLRERQCLRTPFSVM